MKDLFQRLVKTGARPQTPTGEPRIRLAALGKHPAWDDHIPGIGLDTENLAYLKQTLYVGGIGGQIDSGAWEKLGPENRHAGFEHVFLWLRGGSVIVGRFWSSTDGKGRAKYPMVICADCEGVPPAFALASVRPELERLREACKAATSAQQVNAETTAAQERLNGMLARVGSSPADATPRAEAKRSFLERRELGPERLGLLRVTHELGNASGDALRPCHIRLPRSADSENDGLLLWAAFLRSALPESAPLLLISRCGVDWLDVIIGDPAGDEFFCLQAAPKALPLATEIPYELLPEAKPRLQAWEAKFLGLEPPPAVRVAAAPVAIAAAPPASSTTLPADTRPPKKKFWAALLGGGAVVLVLIAGLIWLSGKPGDEAATQRKTPEPVASKPPVQPDSSTNRFAELIAQGKKSLTDRQHAEAERSFAEALRLKPGDSQAAELLAESQRAGKQAGADAEFARLLGGGRSALESKRLDEGVAQLKKALALKPNDPQALELMARVTQQLAGKTEEDYRTALAAAKQALSAANMDEALRQAEAALKAKPGDAEAAGIAKSAGQQKEMAAARERDYATTMASAQTALSRKDYPAALAQVAAALKLKPGDSTASQLQAKVETQQKATIAAAAQETRYNANMSAAREAHAQKSYTIALRELESALQLKSNDPAAIQLKAAVEAEMRAAAATRASEKQYADAMDGAGTALAKADFTEATRLAGVALAAKSGDSAAESLKRQVAQRQVAATPAATATSPQQPAVPAIAPAAPVSSSATSPVAVATPGKTVVNGIGMEFVWVSSLPGGGAYVGKHEVTKKQFQTVMGKLPEDQFGEQDDLPVVNVPFEQAVEFCKVLSRRGEGEVSLLRKEQWLAAAGLSPEQANSAWTVATSRPDFQNEVTSWKLPSGQSLKSPARVGGRGPQSSGLCDVLGNVRELTAEKESAGFSFDTEGYGLRKSLFVGGDNLRQVARITGFRCILWKGS